MRAIYAACASHSLHVYNYSKYANHRATAGLLAGFSCELYRAFIAEIKIVKKSSL